MLTFCPPPPQKRPSTTSIVPFLLLLIGIQYSFQMLFNATKKFFFLCIATSNLTCIRLHVDIYQKQDESKKESRKMPKVVKFISVVLDLESPCFAVVLVIVLLYFSIFFCNSVLWYKLQ